MKVLLLIGLIISLIIYSIRIIMWIITMTKLYKENDLTIKLYKGNELTTSLLKDMKISRSTFAIGGLEHLVIFISLLGALLFIL